MPIFFLVAGFFGALLFYRKSPILMLKNRISRIGFPFIFFLILLTPLHVFSTTFTGLAFKSNNNTFGNAIKEFCSLSSYIPYKPDHLWFLYYLMIISVSSVIIALLFRKLPSVNSLIKRSFDYIFIKPILRVIVFAILTCCIYLILGVNKIESSNSLTLNFKIYIFYLFFYVNGWILFKSKHLLGEMKQYDWACFGIAIILFLIKIAKYSNLHFLELLFLNASLISLFTFGITGLFIRYSSKYSPVMKYISDSSYWVYLVHFVFTIFLPGLLAPLKINSFFKVFIVLTLTTIISFVTYHAFVRKTFIGNFLNGKKY